jgi:hypothetical protein
MAVLAQYCSTDSTSGMAGRKWDCMLPGSSLSPGPVRLQISKGLGGYVVLAPTCFLVWLKSVEHIHLFKRAGDPPVQEPVPSVCH